jgi:hypothetical protein
MEATINFQNYYSHYDYVFVFEPINPGIIIHHNWKNLRQIWKSINSEYKAALHRFMQSGTHDDNFYNYCVGQQTQS